jgi:hypothetical protein
MIRWGNTLYAVEPNHQELDRIGSDGAVSRVVDFSRTFPGNTDWRGPTAMVRHGDSFYIGTLTPFQRVWARPRCSKSARTATSASSPAA